MRGTCTDHVFLGFGVRDLAHPAGQRSDVILWDFWYLYADGPNISAPDLSGLAGPKLHIWVFEGTYSGRISPVSFAGTAPHCLLRT